MGESKSFLFVHVSKTLVWVQGLLRHLLMVSCTCCRILRCVKLCGFLVSLLVCWALLGGRQLGPKPVKYGDPSAQGGRLSLEEVLPPAQQLAAQLVMSVRTGFGDSVGQSCLPGCSEGPSLFTQPCASPISNLWIFLLSCKLYSY